MDKIDKVSIVGGGDSGLLAALIIKKTNNEVEVSVIDDFSREIPHVGKSTFDYIFHILHNLLEIDERQFVTEVKPAWKASVYFQDWCGQGPFHVPFDDYSIPPSEPGKERFDELYYRYLNSEFRTIDVELVEQQKSPFRKKSGAINRYNSVAYHLDVNNFNQFLRNLCRQRGINIIDDKITQVETANDEIDSIASEVATYEADLYIDATGFNRTLMSNLSNPFIEFDFPLDSALQVNYPIDHSEVVPATVINSGSSGWFWQIDTLERRDVGYVYSSSHLANKDARMEFVNHCESDLSQNDIRRYRFDAGVFKYAWMKNCVAVGNALGFVEPLQSTALTLSASLNERFGLILSDHNRINHQGIRSIYNSLSESVWDNVFQFVAAHYLYSDGEGEFWNDIQNIGGVQEIDEICQLYNENGFNSFSEFDSDNELSMKIFNQWSFYRLLRSLGVDSDFYNRHDFDLNSSVAKEIENEKQAITERVGGHLTYPETVDFLYNN